MVSRGQLLRGEKSLAEAIAERQATEQASRGAQREETTFRALERAEVAGGRVQEEASRFSKGVRGVVSQRGPTGKKTFGTRMAQLLRRSVRKAPKFQQQKRQIRQVKRPRPKLRQPVQRQVQQRQVYQQPIQKQNLVTQQVSILGPSSILNTPTTVGVSGGHLF